MLPWDNQKWHWYYFEKIQLTYVLAILYTGVLHNIIGQVEKLDSGEWRWYARKIAIGPLEVDKTGIEPSKDLAMKAAMDALNLSKEEQEVINKFPNVDFVDGKESENLNGLF